MAVEEAEHAYGRFGIDVDAELLETADVLERFVDHR